MTRDEAIARLKPFEAALRDLGATGLFLFGSTARNEATAASDLDLFLDYDRSRPFGLFDVLSAQYLIADELAVSVDIMTRSSLHPRIKPEAERDAVRIF